MVPTETRKSSRAFPVAALFVAGWLLGIAAFLVTARLGNSRFFVRELPSLLVFTSAACFVQFLLSAFVTSFRVFAGRTMAAVGAGLLTSVVPMWVLNLLLGGPISVLAMFATSGPFVALFGTSGVVYCVALATISRSPKFN